MTFCLLVEEPLIDFDPLQSCLLNSLTTSLSRHLALVFIKNLTEGRELFFTFVLAYCLSQFLLAFQLPHFLASFKACLRIWWIFGWILIWVTRIHYVYFCSLRLLKLLGSCLQACSKQFGFQQIVGMMSCLWKERKWESSGLYSSGPLCFLAKHLFECEHQKSLLELLPLIHKFLKIIWMIITILRNRGNINGRFFNKSE